MDLREGTAVAGLSFLIALFCLYVLNTLLQNGRLKSLLVEMNGMAATGMELDSFLPSIAKQIARTTSVDMCEIALLAQSRPDSTAEAENNDDKLTWQVRIGRTCSLEQSAACRRALDSLRPVTARPSKKPTSASTT